MKIAILRPVTLVILLIGFIAILINFPFTTERVTAASSSAMPVPTPPDQEAVDAFVEQLKGTLPDAVGDEDAVNSIIERWDRRSLSGKTKRQIIDLLFADVKIVAKNNKKVQDAVWKSWSDAIAEASAEEEEDEPAVPAASPDKKEKAQMNPMTAEGNVFTENGIEAPMVDGRWVLTDERKKRFGPAEIRAFDEGYSSVKTWRSEPRQYKGQQYSISIPTDPVDPNMKAKVAGIAKAVSAVVDRGFVLPYDLQFYCIPVDGIQTRAFKRGTNWAPVAYIFIGPGGRPDALSTTAAGFNGFDGFTIRTIHEIGHIIHERQAGDSYWEPGRKFYGADEVSGYATIGDKEFIAEAFAGLVIGKRWSNKVMNEYRRFRGPVPAIF